MIVVEKLVERELDLGAFASYLFQFDERESLLLRGGVERSRVGMSDRSVLRVEPSADRRLICAFAPRGGSGCCRCIGVVFIGSCDCYGGGMIRVMWVGVWRHIGGSGKVGDIVGSGVRLWDGGFRV